MFEMEGVNWENDQFYKPWSENRNYMNVPWKSLGVPAEEEQLTVNQKV